MCVCVVTCTLDSRRNTRSNALDAHDLSYIVLPHAPKVSHTETHTHIKQSMIVENVEKSLETATFMGRHASRVTVGSHLVEKNFVGMKQIRTCNFGLTAQNLASELQKPDKNSM